MSDLYVNKIGNVMVVAPSPKGQLGQLVEYRNVVFYAEKGEQVKAITRWVFADFQKGTLNDQWGNQYDHQVHSLLSGNLSQGQRFIEMLSDVGFIIAEEGEMFVPFQKIDICSQSNSDALRESHPRAFALARSGKKSISALVTDIRDSLLVGKA